MILRAYFLHSEKLFFGNIAVILCSDKTKSGRPTSVLTMGVKTPRFFLDSSFFYRLTIPVDMCILLRMHKFFLYRFFCIKL